MSGHKRWSAQQLFAQRVRADWKYQWKIWTLTVDWVTWLYVIIPVLAIGGVYYGSFWQGNVEWFASIPYMYVLIALYLYTWTGQLRFFVERADQLFLRQRKRWIKQIMNRGSMYSLLSTAVSLSVVFIFVAPFFMINQGMDLLTFILVVGFVCLFKWNVLLIRSLKRISQKRLRDILLDILLFGAGGLCFVWVLFHIQELTFGALLSCVILLLLLPFLWNLKMSQQGNFSFDCLREEKHKLRYAKWVLGASSATANQIGTEPFMKRKPKQPRQEPGVFRNSAVTFQERTPANILTETYLKSFLRNRQQLADFGKILGVSLFGIVLLPLYLKWVMWIISYFLIRQWVVAGWREMENSTFFKLFHWTEDVQRQGLQKAVRIILIPGFLLISVVLGLSIILSFVTF